LRICVCVKKRPIFQKELENSQVDCISNTNPYIIVHECKYKVDGITKYIDNQDFHFDNTFGEVEETDEVYKYMVKPVLDLVFETGTITIFAYG
jgi:kinesin family protein 2/24